ncbi:MAG: polyprenyl synthetase family protein [Gemella sp.]|nr:polyprenyl synthetase family protein [Gemella sp.]
MIEKYKKDIALAREEIKNIYESDDKELNSIIDEYFKAGGKGIRLILSLVFSRLGNYEKEYSKLIRNAGLVELIHTTSLIHDDIIDGADSRRNKPTLNNIYGNKKALFIGDYLFSTILKEASSIPNVEFHKYLSITLKELVYGELIQNKDLYNINTRKLDYLKKIKRKTAILIAFACVSATILAEASEEEIRASYKFGYYLGMSYQIMDDYLDFISDKDSLGKDIGQDLVNGNITLPIILKIKKDRERFLNYKELSLKEKLVLVDEIKHDQEIMNELKDISDRYLKKSLDELKIFDDSIKEDLKYIVKILRDREK